PQPTRAQARACSTRVPARARPNCKAGMDSSHGRTRQAKPDYPSRPRRACDLLRRLHALGGGDGADPKIWDDGEIAERLSDAVALYRSRKQAGRAHDAHFM